MDTGPSESDSAMLDPSQTGSTLDYYWPYSPHELRRGHTQSEGIFRNTPPLFLQDDNPHRLYTAGLDHDPLLLFPEGYIPSPELRSLFDGLLSRADDAMVPRWENLGELDSRHELPAGDASASPSPKDSQNPDPVQTLGAKVVQDVMEPYPHGNAAMEHQLLLDDSKLDSASIHTFQTAPTTVRTYVTAQSVANYEMWQDGLLDQQPGNDDSAYRKKAHEKIHAAFADELTFESLVSAVVSTLEIEIRQKASQSIQAAIGEELRRLWSPSDAPMSINDLITGLLLRLAQACSSANTMLDQQSFADRTEQLIWEYAVNRQDLQKIVRTSLSTCKTFGSQWLRLLSTRGLILDPKEALDWSGRGQHVQYSPEEEASIPLDLQGNLGFGTPGLVDRVRCRRIDLARKTIQCVRNLTREEAAKEVAHLQHLQHQHIVRLVGTYTLKKKLSILMYPATDYNLAEFLDHAHDELTSSKSSLSTSLLGHSWSLRLSRIMGCLVNALKFIHSHSTKHMDIKPTNILVNFSQAQDTTRVYITDFGISRSYQSTEASFTDSPISYTRVYAAPEVTQQITRGPPADIFSLGCVFAEILATLLSTPTDSQQEQLRRIRNEGADTSYQANIEKVIEWSKSYYKAKVYLGNPQGTTLWQYRPYFEDLMALLPPMLASSPEARPSAAKLWNWVKDYACTECESGPEPFRAA